ncbi:F-box protein CPR30-like [Durio zibethinus]|uniref:F-box protein CPR30-like n=1 Tax=Durio zibethinus TaxID=66656 RepID=A0A6P6BAC8_DURZI|nr:F-box protein CPR30-like [Durio zibethinus]
MGDFSSSNDLPKDLMMEILLNLPVKSLLRFKSVCKSWYALINSNKFITMHLDRSRRNNKESILIKRFNSESSQSKASLSMISHNDSSCSGVDVYLGILGNSSVYDLELSANCDGIIFYSNYSQGYSVLCNLATRETILVPDTSSGNDSSYLYSVAFGYDLKNHRYKAVRITKSRRDNDRRTSMVRMSYNVEVYTLGTYSWRQVNNGKLNSLNSRQISAPHGSFYFNGAIHWKGFPERPDSNDIVIIVFNLSDEEFDIIPLPDDVKPFMHFLVWDRSFAVSHVTHRNHSLLDIFAMKEYGVKESWTKVFAIEIGHFIFVRPLAVWKNNEIVFEIMDDKDRINFQLVTYNLKRQEFKKLQILGPLLFKAYVYMESLVPIKSRGESIA